MYPGRMSVFRGTLEDEAGYSSTAIGIKIDRMPDKARAGGIDGYGRKPHKARSNKNTDHS